MRETRAGLHAICLTILLYCTNGRCVSLYKLTCTCTCIVLLKQMKIAQPIDMTFHYFLTQLLDKSFNIF